MSFFFFGESSEQSSIYLIYLSPFLLSPLSIPFIFFLTLPYSLYLFVSFLIPFTLFSTYLIPSLPFLLHTFLFPLSKPLLSYLSITSFSLLTLYFPYTPLLSLSPFTLSPPFTPLDTPSHPSSSRQVTAGAFLNPNKSKAFSHLISIHALTL